jgi:hypothetical protein
MRHFCIPNTSSSAILAPNLLMNTNLTSLAVNCVNTYTYGIQVFFTGTPTGTFKLQCSMDPAVAAEALPQASVFQPVNWTDIPQSSFAVTSAGNEVWNIQDIGYNWVRLVYTDSSGGTSTARLTVCTFNSKGY